MTKLAAFLTPGKTIAQAVERVKLAESLGYEAAYTTHIAARDGLMTLAAYAAGTERIKLGTGVIPAFSRHPVALATEAATVDEISDGRLILGLGMAHRVTMENWYAEDMSKPLTRFQEYVEIVRSIFRTGRVQHAGEFYRSTFAFMGYEARPDIPIYTASLGPNSLRWAGAASDGIILWSCMPRYISEQVVPLLHEGAVAAGRDPKEVEIVAAVPCAVTHDVAAARNALRQGFFVYMTLPFYRRAIEGAGFGEDIAAFDAKLAAGDNAGALVAISDEMLEHFAGIGTPEVVRAKIAEYRDAGVTQPAVSPFSMPKDAGGSPEETLEAAIAE